MHIAICSEISPELASEITIAVSAPEDCITAVNSAPRINRTITSQVSVPLPLPRLLKRFSIDPPIFSELTRSPTAGHYVKPYENKTDAL